MEIINTKTGEKMEPGITIKIKVNFNEVGPKDAIEKIRSTVNEGLNSLEKNMAKLEVPVLIQAKELKKFCLATIETPNLLVIEFQ